MSSTKQTPSEGFRGVGGGDRRSVTGATVLSSTYYIRKKEKCQEPYLDKKCKIVYNITLRGVWMITYDDVKVLRDKGLSWRDIGFHFESLYGGEAYIWQERARRRIRLQKKIEKQKGASEVSTVVEMEEKERPLEIEDEEGMLRYHGYDPKGWEVIDSSMAIYNGKLSSRIKVRPIQNGRITADVLHDIVCGALETYPLPPRQRYRKGTSIVVIPLYDLHYGRRGVKGDYRDTERMVLSAIESTISYIRDNQPKKILLPIGQDFLNCDNVFGTTTKGTPQDNSLPWYEIFSRGLNLAIEIVDRLVKVAPVEIRYSMGNHDEALSYAIVKALAQRYRKYPYITVCEDASPRQYERDGQTLIGLTHGKEESNLSTLMQTEAREDWGQTAHHYWIVGHLHHIEIDEKDGITIIRCPSLAIEDEWMRKKGLVGSRKVLMSLRFDENQGLEDIHFETP